MHRVYTRIYSEFRAPIKIIKNTREDALIRLFHISFPSAGNAGDTALSTMVRSIFNITFGKVSWKLRKAFRKVSESVIQQMQSL